ncbi:MAG: ASCH domain-containing protein [Bacilli bacterium]|nr:ASCH domain-containing protein [Bacilli bacterium]
MKHEIHLHDEPFKLIKNGFKTIEMRLYDEKRKKIKVGDYIEFTNRVTSEKLVVEVMNLYLFDSFKDLYDNFDKKFIGYKEEEEARPSDMEKYYDRKDIEKYGVVGIEIKVI